MRLPLRQAAGRERGSALVEAALIMPILVILLYWAIGMTDIMVLRTKASEAARFALWENTVFRAPAEISQDVTTRFRDLRSPAGTWPSRCSSTRSERIPTGFVRRRSTARIRPG